jgi:hypothetical protein
LPRKNKLKADFFMCIHNRHNMSRYETVLATDVWFSNIFVISSKCMKALVNATFIMMLDAASNADVFVHRPERWWEDELALTVFMEK